MKEKINVFLSRLIDIILLERYFGKRSTARLYSIGLEISQAVTTRTSIFIHFYHLFDWGLWETN